MRGHILVLPVAAAPAGLSARFSGTGPSLGSCATVAARGLLLSAEVLLFFPSQTIPFDSTQLRRISGRHGGTAAT